MHKPFDRSHHPPSPYDPQRYHGKPPPPPPPKRPPHFENKNNSLTRETSKIVELKDKFGNTRFKIGLTDYDDPLYPEHDDLQHWDTLYQVTVVSYCCKDEDQPITLFEQTFNDYEEAVNKLNELVEQYRVLINAETKGWQDITAYADRINFRTIDPDCCKNCMWAKPVPYSDQLFSDWRRHHSRMVCANPEVVKYESDFHPMEKSTSFLPSRENAFRH